MANVGIAALAVGSLTFVVVLFLRLAPGQQRRRTRILVGLIPGLVGAAVVGALTTDLVPDRFETVALPWVVVAVSIGMVALTVRNLAAR